MGRGDRGCGGLCRSACAVSLAAVLLGPWASAPASAAATPALTLSQAAVTLGTPLSASGTVPGGAGIAVALEADPWPYRGYAVLARAVSGAGGAYAFPPLRPDRNVTLRVSAAGAQSAPAALTVFPRVRMTARTLGPGRTLLELGVRHVPSSSGAGAAVRWFAAERGTRAYHLVAVSPSRELAGGLLSAQVVIDPPARRFTFRVCLNPPWEAAMGTAQDRGPCPRTGFVLPATGGRR